MSTRIGNKILILFCILLVGISTFLLFIPIDQLDVYFINYVVDGILGLACIIIYG